MSRKRRKNHPTNVRSLGDPPLASAPARGDPFPHASIVVSALLLAAVFFVFGQTVHHGFLHFDDPTYVSENPELTEGSTIDKIAWAFTTDCAGNWHPLTWLSHLSDCSIYGVENAGGHHLTNVLLHAASAIVLFLALRRMTGDFWPAALAAALFAIHPLRVESVAWVAERKDVLSGLFFMLTLWFYAGYASRPFSLARYLAVVASLALGLLAKPTLVTLPLVLLLLDYWPLGRLQSRQPAEICAGTPGGRRLIVEKIPLFVLAAGSCIVTFLVQRAGVEAFVDAALPWRIGNAVVAYVAYLIQFFCPINLAIMYPHPGEDLPLWKIAAAAIALIAISAGVVKLRRRSPYLVTGWLWYLGMLVPMIGLVQVGWQSRADRYTYLPQIGVCIMVAWGVHQAAVSRVAQRWATVGALAALAILTGLAYRQTALWRSDETLWKHAIACTENNYVAHLHIAMAMTVQERFPEAIEHYQAADRLAQNKTAKCYAANAVTIATKLGFLYSKMGRLDEAVAQYERALKAEPKNARVHVNLAAVLKNQGRFDDAISHCKIALDIDPKDAMAHNNLGASLEAQGKLFAAMSHYEQAVELRPDFADARGNLAAIMRQVQNSPAAIVRWREWIDLRPTDYVLMNQAALLMATSSDASLRNGADAVELARRAVQLVGEREPTTLATLAAAYAEAGRFPDAVQTARQALALAQQQGNRALVKSIEEKLPLYESQKPYHETPPAPGSGS